MSLEPSAPTPHRRRRKGLHPWMFNLYPPFLGAGIRVRRIADDPPGYETVMKLRFWNRNYVGTHYGGSLYSMCDPFFMLILIAALGRGYVVWDKSATIRFRRPGRGTMRARFSISAEQLAEIRAAADRGEKVEPIFTARVVDAGGELVAEVDKLLSVRRA